MRDNHGFLGGEACVLCLKIALCGLVEQKVTTSVAPSAGKTRTEDPDRR